MVAPSYRVLYSMHSGGTLGSVLSRSIRRPLAEGFRGIPEVVSIP